MGQEWDIWYQNLKKIMGHWYQNKVRCPTFIRLGVHIIVRQRTGEGVTIEILKVWDRDGRKKNHARTDISPTTQYKFPLRNYDSHNKMWWVHCLSWGGFIRQRLHSFVHLCAVEHVQTCCHASRIEKALGQVYVYRVSYLLANLGCVDLGFVSKFLKQRLTTQEACQIKVNPT